MHISKLELSHQTSAHDRNNFPMWPFLYLSCGLGLLILLFHEGLAYMLSEWEREEYSHGYIIPIISAYFLLQKLPTLEDIKPKGQYWGGAIVLAGLCVFVVGELSSLYSIIQYAFIFCVSGLFVSLLGINGSKKVYVAFIYLLFMIPLPHFLHFSLSSQLQLISSSLGVYILRLLNISVFLEGNVIDLGSYQLQVVDACSGLRYLFPLMSFGFLIAYIYKSPLWFKAVIFLSTIPITIFMNSFRIAVIGITVDSWGIAAAEGFIHDFEGWVVFMACVFLLFLEVWVFHKLSSDKEMFANKLNVFLAEDIFRRSYIQNFLAVTKIQLLIIVALILMIPAISITNERVETLPQRSLFSELPLIQGMWQGKEKRIDAEVQDTLKFSDYVISDYSHLAYELPVNLYIAYYDSQRKGASIHSPKTCIPGGGWDITSLNTKKFPHISASNSETLRVNRAVIQKGETQSIVYYWFQQRGRIITNEYAAKWYIFWDALTKNRTDGALVRITTQVTEGMELEEADKLLQDFLIDFSPLLKKYIPD